MLSVSAIALLAIGIIVVLITSGSANTLLAAAGLRQGMRRSLPLIAAVALAWIAFGAALGSGKLAWLNPVKMQRGASILLGVFCLSLAWAALH